MIYQSVCFGVKIGLVLSKIIFAQSCLRNVKENMQLMLQHRIKEQTVCDINKKKDQHFVVHCISDLSNGFKNVKL